MLVLSRFKDESIMIGDEIEIVIADVRGNKVRLGIRAPRHIPVHRMEVYEAIQRQNITNKSNNTKAEREVGVLSAGSAT